MIVSGIFVTPLRNRCPRPLITVASIAKHRSKRAFCGLHRISLTFFVNWEYQCCNFNSK
jgi:hypothetical protein